MQCTGADLASHYFYYGVFASQTKRHLQYEKVEARQYVYSKLLEAKARQCINVKRKQTHLPISKAAFPNIFFLLPFKHFLTSSFFLLNPYSLIVYKSYILSLPLLYIWNSSLKKNLIIFMLMCEIWKNNLVINLGIAINLLKLNEKENQICCRVETSS